MFFCFLVFSVVHLIGKACLCETEEYKFPDIVEGHNDRRCLDRINERRRQYAKQKHITNMNKLVYSEQMEKFADEHVTECAVNESITIEEGSPYEIHLEESSPVQMMSHYTKIACVQKCPGNVIIIKSYGFNYTLYGGDPGSDCAKGIHQDGLCTNSSHPALNLGVFVMPLTLSLLFPEY